MFCVPEQDVDFIVDLHKNEGLNARQISERLFEDGRTDWHESTVLSVLKRAGVYQKSTPLISSEELAYFLEMRREGLTARQMSARLKAEGKGTRSEGTINDALRRAGYPSVGNKDLEVVRGSQLTPVMKKWVTDYLSDRPISHSDRRGNPFARSAEDFFFGPIQALAFRTEIHVRKVSMICNGTLEYVPLKYADPLLNAIDREYLLSNGTIEVIPNPYINRESWIKLMEERGCV